MHTYILGLPRVTILCPGRKTNRVRKNRVGKDVALSNQDRLRYRFNHNAESTADEINIGATSIESRNKFVNARAGTKGRIAETLLNLRAGGLDDGQTSSEGIFKLGIAFHCLERPGGNLFTLTQGGRENILQLAKEQ